MKFFILLLAALTIGCGKIKETASETNVEEVEKQEKPVSLEQSSKDETVRNIVFDVKVPSSLNYAGKIRVSVSWDDSNGENILFVTETNEEPFGNEGSRKKELHGYHYVNDGSKYSKLWQINDLIEDCQVDITLEYIANSLTITDLDNDGTGESTFLYKLSCKGDVSPDELKLMMHEDDTKYAIRGETVITYVVDGYKHEDGGRMSVDKSFDNAPDGFLSYAKEQWHKHKVIEY